MGDLKTAPRGLELELRARSRPERSSQSLGLFFEAFRGLTRNGQFRHGFARSEQVVHSGIQAQDASTGALRRVVTDATGARIAGAEMRLINAQTGVERSAIASSEGVFVFQLLPPGEYGLQVTSPGIQDGTDGRELQPA